MSTPKLKRGETVFATKFGRNAIFLGTEDGESIIKMNTGDPDSVGWFEKVPMATLEFAV